MNKTLTQNDKDLITALAGEYLNVYRVNVAEDLADVVKLDGYIINGLVDQWNDLCYSETLKMYAEQRVHPEDREEFLLGTSTQNVIRMMQDNAVVRGKYRILDHDDVLYYVYKYVRVSAPGEPLRVVLAFRKANASETRDQQRMTQLEHLRSILASTQMGTWCLYVQEGHPMRLQPDSKMREILGMAPDADMAPEDICRMLLERIHPADMHTFMQYNEQLMNGRRAECTYRWNHPAAGIRYMRCGGVAVAEEDGVVCLNGYHYDVTEQVQKEIRSNHIIKTFAHTYEFINYLNLDDDSFYTYTEKEIEDETLIKVLMAGSASAAIKIGLEEIVDEKYREEMTAFSDLNTLNERMAKCNVLVAEFQDISGAWQESSFTVAERHRNGTVKHLLWAIRHIDSEKQVELRKQKLLEDNIAANKAKTKFLQNMSHEIRTPLNAMFGFAQLLGLPPGMCTDEERVQYNQYIYNSYNLLEMLIRDIIDIADSEHGNYRIELSNVDVNSVCQNALMTVELRVPADVRMYMTSDFEDGHVIRSDGRRIQQVLVNYLTNACKNTLHGEIHLHCSRTEHPGRITFSVTDTGTGVPPEKADVIFNRFTKLNQYVQGSGLGLNICMTVANKLGGEVYLDTSYTGGARFVFVVDDK